VLVAGSRSVAQALLAEGPEKIELRLVSSRTLETGVGLQTYAPVNA
jgi:hypothetical protein